MGVKIENHCVDCDIPCVDCGAKRTEVLYCDRCDDYAEYKIDGEYFCDECMEAYCNSIFINEHMLEEKLEMLSRYNKSFSFEKCK